MLNNIIMENFLLKNTTIFEQLNKKQELQILEELHIRNIQPKHYKINFETSANVLEYF